MESWFSRVRFHAFVGLVFLSLSTSVFADSIDDEEAKRRGVPVAQVQLENAKAKNAELEKQVADLKEQVKKLSAATSASPPATAASARAKAITKEPWMSQPSAQWPQIHLANDVKLTGNRTMAGASASLIKLNDGRIFGATARHLMGPDGGIDPALKLSEIDSNVLSWNLRTYNAPQAQVRLGKLATKLEDEGVHDCLMFAVAGDLTNLPGLALQCRTNPLHAGDKVYLLGCPYSQTPYRQNAYPGTVKTVTDKGTVDFTLGAALVTRGFSGAPVIDENGHFAGVFCGHFSSSGSATAGNTEVYMVAATTVLKLIPEKK